MQSLRLSLPFIGCVGVSLSPEEVNAMVARTKARVSRVTDKCIEVGLPAGLKVAEKATEYTANGLEHVGQAGIVWGTLIGAAIVAGGKKTLRASYAVADAHAKIVSKQ